MLLHFSHSNLQIIMSSSIDIRHGKERSVWSHVFTRKQIKSTFIPKTITLDLSNTVLIDYTLPCDVTFKNSKGVHEWKMFDDYDKIKIGIDSNTIIVQKTQKDSRATLSFCFHKCKESNYLKLFSVTIERAMICGYCGVVGPISFEMISERLGFVKCSSCTNN